MPLPRSYLLLPVLLGSLLGLLFGRGTVVWAQGSPVPEVPSGHAFARVEGLPHNTVLALLQDAEGFVWVGTSDGMSRYDGYAFVTYRHDPEDATTLAHNTVTALYEAEDGVLWVGTEEGLSAFDRITERFSHFRFGGDTLSQHVHAVFEDADQRLWIGTDHGFIHLDPATKNHRYHALGRPGSLTGFYNMTRPSEDTFWLGTLQRSTRHGLYRFDAQDARFTHYPLPPNWDAASGTGVLWGPQDKLWVGTPQATGAFDPLTARFTPIPGLRGEPWLDDEQGGLWVDDGVSLWRYNTVTHTTTPYHLDKSGTNRLARDVRAMLKDHAGTIWAGTLGGLFRLDAHQKPFVHRAHDAEDPQSLSSNIVMAVHEAPDSTLWVGTLGGGMNQIDLRRQTMTHFRHRRDDPGSICHDDVWAVQEDRAGTLWVGTEAGLCRFDPATERFISVALDDNTSYVYVLAEAPGGHLWIGGKSLTRLDPQTGTQRTYNSVHADEPLHNFQAIYPAPSGEVWVGTEFSGLWRLDPETGVFEAYPPTGPSLQGRAIRTIHGGRDPHQLWVGTDLGLVRIDTESATLTAYRAAHGLPGSSVFGILEDDKGFLWVSTNQGLARFDPVSEDFTVYTRAEGTGNTEYNRRAAFQGPGGTFYFGGLEGLTSFFPEEVAANPHAPPVVLTHVEKRGREGLADIPTGQVTHNGLVLRPQDSAFSFEFAALSFTNPAKNRYAYQLEGFDEGWIDAGTRRFARYSGLPPGRYVFRVRGSNEDGMWNDDGLAIPVHKLPAYWQTWWFRLLIALLVLGLAYSAYRYRVAQLLYEERLRLRIASDLHDEIGSKLSSIALASEMVTARAPLGDRERRQLTEVTQQARTMVDDLRDIVWMVNPRHDRLDNLVARMEHLAANLLDDTPHTFEAPTTSLGTALDMERRRHLYLMYREVLTNIHRHAQATEVHIQLARQNGRLKMTIRDDGVGFDPDAPAHGDGLYNLRMRADALGGSVRINSQPGAGTTVQITAKIPGNRDGFLSNGV